MTQQANLECVAITKVFGGFRALDEFSMSLPAGGIVALIGPNGAGKTTLANVLTGFLRPDSGTVFLRGQSLAGLAPYAIARLGVSRSFQHPRLIRQVSVAENGLLALPRYRFDGVWPAVAGISAGLRHADKRAVEGILSSLGIGSRTDSLAGELSFGQQKLLGLASCALSEAPVLILDEPVAGIDLRGIEIVESVLMSLRLEGRLVIIIEHDLGFVRRVADRVLLMDQGRLMADGPTLEVLDLDLVSEAFLGR